MTKLSIMEVLDVVEHVVGQLESRLPLPAVEQLSPHVRPERQSLSILNVRGSSCFRSRQINRNDTVDQGSVCHVVRQGMANWLQRSYDVLVHQRSDASGVARFKRGDDENMFTT
jgi:hypothetical protein